MTMIVNVYRLITKSIITMDIDIKNVFYYYIYSLSIYKNISKLITIRLYYSHNNKSLIYILKKIYRLKKNLFKNDVS